jgi:hypothetical protein
MSLSERAIQILFFDMVFSGMLAFYDASFGGPTSPVAIAVNFLSQSPPSVFTSTTLNPLQVLVGVAAFLQWFAVELGAILLLVFVLVPITAVPGVPFGNFIFTTFQILLVIWGWTLVKPSGGTPS